MSDKDQTSPYASTSDMTAAELADLRALLDNETRPAWWILLAIVIGATLIWWAV